MRKVIAALICVALLGLTGCRSSAELPEPAPVILGIARHPQPSDSLRLLTSLPAPSENGDARSIDLRSCDLRRLDLSSAYGLLEADFDTKTEWPLVLPDAFRLDQFMELGKNPGLSIRSLHDRGITGKGVSIAIIDQTLLVDHSEYAERIRHYEEIDTKGEECAQMHGAAVASIAVGKFVGVAPGADLYYIAHSFVDGDYGHLATCVDRVVQINRSLPKGEKIRVLAIQTGWDSSSKGARQIGAAVARARSDGIFVITSSLRDYSRLSFQGLGRDPLANPDELSSYCPGGFWAANFRRPMYGGFGPNTILLVPMDSRCVASPTGVDDYAFFRYGGWSWCTPYLAGLYALACQVKPDITPEEFWRAGLRTGDLTMDKGPDGVERRLGMIVNPVRLVDTLAGAK